MRQTLARRCNELLIYIICPEVLPTPGLTIERHSSLLNIQRHYQAINSLINTSTTQTDAAATEFQHLGD